MTSHDAAEGALERIASWGAGRSDIRAVAVVGSYATGRPRRDSDVDVILLTTRPSDYITGDTWIAELGAGDLIQTRQWGAITERRLSGVGGIQLDIGIGEPSWAATSPMDPGTRQVVAHGLRILYDPDCLLERLMRLLVDDIPPPEGRRGHKKIATAGETSGEQRCREVPDELT